MTGEEAPQKLRERLASRWIRGASWAVDFALRVDRRQVLNPGGGIKPSEPIGPALKRLANQMRAEALKAGGVDYRGLGASTAYEQFRELTRSLPHCTSEDLGDRDHQLAFWINLYNVLILDAVIHYQVRGSLLRRPGFFRQAAYNVGGQRFSADDIEHGVLRGNRPHPTLRLRPFAPDDMRRQLSLDPPDPRIHFALNCGARSCPPIAFYDGEQIDRQLDQAASAFLNSGGARYDPEHRVLWLSKLLDSYSIDFGGEQGVFALLERYSQDEALRDALARGDVRLRFQPYDWSVNAVL